MYDTIIIGSGPAGLTAGIYAARREMNVLIIGKELGGQVALASDIENYPGFKMIESFDLVNKMKEQVENLGVKIENSEVKVINKNGEEFEVVTNSQTYQTKTVIIAMGLSPRRLAIEGEEEFTGKGVSYCANCDGPFFKNKNIAVVGGGNAALDAAEILSKIGKKVYLVHRSTEFKAFEVLVDKVKAIENVELILDSEVKKIKGEEKLKALEISNLKTDNISEIEVDGLFIEIGRIAHTDLVEKYIKRDKRKQLLVDVNCLTKTPGMFACGDVTDIKFKQITTATGQGTIAALSAYQYLQLKEGNEQKVVMDRSIKKA